MHGHQEEDDEHPGHAVREEYDDAQGHHGDLENLDADQDLALADGIRQLPGVSGEEQRRQHEDGAGEREVFAALVGLRDDVDRAQRDDDAVGVIVERAQKLRPEEGDEAAIFQNVFESAVCHARFQCTAPAAAPVLERYHGSMV